MFRTPFRALTALALIDVVRYLAIPKVPLAVLPLNKTVMRPVSVGTQDLTPLVNTAQLSARVEI